MIDVDRLRRAKKEGLACMLERLEPWRGLLDGTDGRLTAYIEGVAREGGARHSVWEVLAVMRFLDLLGRYGWRKDRVERFVRLYESLMFNGMDGRRRYRLTPVQVFQFASIFGFVREDGTRLVRQAILFVPRKFGKSTSAASLAVNELLFGDANGQVYVASNNQEQSGICFGEARALVEQIDPEGRRFRTTQSEISWKRNALGKECFVKRLTAGAKTKDGLNASLAIFDEYGAARYVKDHSDGAELLQVLESSMGTRREPLTVIITTASRVQEGPFEVMLRGAKEALLEGGDDWLFASIFQPDPWLIAEERFDDSDVWRMCNPHIGVTVQPGFYAEEWARAMRDPEKRKEFLCKYLNVFQTDKVRDWILPGEIVAAQVERRITDIDPRVERWACFVGMDFSRGDDLCGMAYLCFDPKGKGFFVDCDAWITRRTLLSHPNRTLYGRWVEAGWLHVTEGDVIPEQVVTDRLAVLAGHVQLVRVGYDPYDARDFVAYLEAWLRAGHVDPGKVVRPVRQTWGSFNASVQAFERKLREGRIGFCPNPLLPWCFGNAVLTEDMYENVKPTKRTEAGKIDLVICILEGFVMLDEALANAVRR